MTIKNKSQEKPLVKLVYRILPSDVMKKFIEFLENTNLYIDSDVFSEEIVERMGRWKNDKSLAKIKFSTNSLKQDIIIIYHLENISALHRIKKLCDDFVKVYPIKIIIEHSFSEEQKGGQNGNSYN